MHLDLPSHPGSKGATERSMKKRGPDLNYIFPRRHKKPEALEGATGPKLYSADILGKAVDSKLVPC